MDGIMLYHLYDSMKDELKGVFTSVESSKNFLNRFGIHIIKEEMEEGTLYMSSWNKKSDRFDVYELCLEVIE